MKWFVITNREKISKRSFGGDLEPAGKLHFLSRDAKMPRRNRNLRVDHLGSSDEPDAVRGFAKQVRKELQKRCDALEARGIERKPCLLLYAHGFNNIYREALEQYVELRRNFHQAIGEEAFEDQCLPILFTWPSEGSKLTYLEDRDDARMSYPAVRHMVHLLLQETRQLENCISEICFLGHSLGVYVLREAFAALVGSPTAPAGTITAQVLMIAADIGNKSLEPNGKGFGINRFSDRVTVYFSPHDDTLRASKRKNASRRLGRTLSSTFETTPDKVLFVDCRKWANDDKLDDLFGRRAPSVHSCYRSVPAILMDMFKTIAGVDREVIPGRDSLVLNKLYRLRAP